MCDLGDEFDNVIMQEGNEGICRKIGETCREAARPFV